MKVFDKVKRYNEIASIAMENEAFSLFLRFLTASREHGFIVTDIKVPEDMPKKFRKLLEQLGPGFIKIGQFLSTRPDLMPRGIVDELQNLYDQTPPTPIEDVRRVIREEFSGKDISDLFASFEEEPIASASIAQVHRAVLKTGERVAVKIQHPGIEENLIIDMDILAKLARFVEKEFADARVWQPQKHLEEFRKMITKELDFREESRNQMEFYENFMDMEGIIIPKIYPELTSKRVLTMEFIDGIKPINGEVLAQRNVNGKDIARNLTNAMAKQIFIDRLFHADPSPGNLLITESGKIAFLDFGAVGVITRRRKDALIQMVMAFVTSNVDELARSFITLCNREGEIDEISFTRDVEKVIDYFEREKPSVGDPAILNMVIEASNKHRMLLPADFMLIMKAWYQFEGLCKRLDPDYDVAVVIEPYLKDTIMAKLTEEKQKEMLNTLLFEYLKFLEKLPVKLNTILRKIENNEVQLRVSQVGIREEREHTRRLTLVTSFSILMAAILIGFSLVLTFGSETIMRSYLIGIFILSLLWFFISILAVRKY